MLTEELFGVLAPLTERLCIVVAKVLEILQDDVQSCQRGELLASKFLLLFFNFSTIILVCSRFVTLGLEDIVKILKI